MNKLEHGLRLKAAMARKQMDRSVIADATDSSERTVTNWTTGKTMPSDRQKEVLRHLLGPYDDPGDPVELAVRSSRLTEDRQHIVLGTYKRQLREQDDEEETRSRGA